MARVPRLSKSRFQAGLQCPRYLWLLCHSPGSADVVTPAQQALFDTGHEVGRVAREQFPGGVLVSEDHLHSQQALKTTDHLLCEGFTCLYEAAFCHEDVLVRSDILKRDEAGSWILVEVKSSGGVKPEHITDMGIQTYVLRGSGLPVAGCRLMHVDWTHGPGEGPCSPQWSFSLVDVTDEVQQFLPAVPGLLAGMKDTLAGPLPAMPTDERCRSPYTCPFYGYCHESVAARSPQTCSSAAS
mgnify:CR=1 FL=1